MKYLFYLFTGVLFLTAISSAKAQDSTSYKKTLVYKIDIKSEIDPRSNRETDQALKAAEKSEADVVLIEMNTYGGALSDADEIRTRILNFPKPVYVFINKNAASAGALISIACDSIYMAEGASIGAATVVTADGAAAPDKYQSYMQGIMRSTAEATGRDPNIAEAMVDEDLVIDGISEAGSVITFSTKEAIKYGFCEAQVASSEEVLERLGIDNYEIKNYESSFAEDVISFFLNPFVSGILVLMIMGGIWFELQTPGVGFPLMAAVLATICYLTPYYMIGLAENWEIAAFIVGIILIALEIFVIPGFGVAGISGLILTVGSLILIMLNNDIFDFSFVGGDQVFVSTAIVFASALGAMVLFLIGSSKIANSKAFSRIALSETMDREDGYTSNFNKTKMTGKTGTAYTILRPSGKVLIDGEIYDAYTRGNYVEKDSAIEVISDEGTSLKVKEITA